MKKKFEYKSIVSSTDNLDVFLSWHESSMKKLGEEGWEAFSTTKAGSFHVTYLKRPIEEPSIRTRSPDEGAMGETKEQSDQRILAEKSVNYAVLCGHLHYRIAPNEILRVAEMMADNVLGTNNQDRNLFMFWFAFYVGQTVKVIF